MSRSIAHRKTESIRAATREARSVPIGSLSIAEFCQSENISQSKYFKEARAGRGPDTHKVGSRTLIAIESAQRWREARTAAHLATKAAETAKVEKVAKPHLKASSDIERARADIAEAVAKIERANAAIEKASKPVAAE
jgi:hypothetical protein